MDARASTGFDPRQQLAQAQAMLETGEVEPARQLASDVLNQAEALADGALQGRALMVLAQYDRVVGRFRRAVDTTQRAAQQFQIEGDIAAEASALSLLAHACSYLGRDEEAVEAGLLSVQLGDLLTPHPQQVNHYNYLGVACLWAKSFGSAERALREAERLALSFGADSNVLLPRINLAWLECVRLFYARCLNGEGAGTELLRQRLDLCADLFDDDAPFPGLPGVRAILQRFGRCAWALLSCWTGQLDAAQGQLALAEDRSGRGNYAQVANFIVHWVRAELARARRDLPTAKQEARTLIERSSQAEFEPMASLGHVLLAQLHAEQGQYALARDEDLALRRRELRVRADILDSRQRSVAAQLEMRSNKRHLQALSKHAEELERMSYEDALTGIANRRRFEQQLELALAEPTGPRSGLCVALIDLDEFKRVNDEHSHAAGDEVLKSVARALKSVVRESDLAARLGGDEFVVMFARTDAPTAQQVCERIQAQVGQLSWPALAPGLRVGLSVGLAQAAPGDTVASLLQRSDRDMFQAKGRARHLAADTGDATARA